MKEQVMSPTDCAMASDGGMMRRRRLGHPHELPEGHDHGDQECLDEQENGPLASADEHLQLIGQELVVVDSAVEADPSFTTPTKSTRATPADGQLALPDAPEHAVGEPRSFQPVQPLFSAQQLRQLEESQRKSPLLQRREDRDDGTLAAKGERVQEVGAGKGKGEAPKASSKPSVQSRGPQYFNVASNPSSAAEQEEEVMWRWQVGKELRELGLLLRASQEENKKLKKELDEARNEAFDGRFHTPEEEKIVKSPLGVRALQDGRPAGDDQQETIGAAPLSKDGNLAAEDKKMEFMMLMLQNMQQIQRQLIDKDDGGSVGGVEVVRSGTTDLPLLAEWDPVDGPLKMGDWMAMLEPAIADLTATSEIWWKEIVKEVGIWYQDHLKLAPLERAAHLPIPPDSLVQRRWQRLERRVASMLLKSVPEQQRTELVSTKRLAVYGILCHLQVVYQPGGLGEKQMLIRNLEEPPEANTLVDAVQGLRRWVRWRQRAKELQASEPDPTVLVRALNRITGKVLEMHKDLNFRIALSKSTLLVDTAPTKQVVEQFATHLLAEIEQVSHVEKKTFGSTSKAAIPKVENPKIRKMEEDSKGVGKGGDRKPFVARKTSEEKGKPACRFYMTDDGCKKGKACTWSHVIDESLGTKRRCWSCGSTRHFSSSCPTSSATSIGTSSSDGGSPPKVKSAKEEMEPCSSFEKSEKEENPAKVEKPDEQMKSLIEEANRMLKSLNRKSEPLPPAQASLEDLQRQLDVLKGNPRSLRALRLTKMSTSMEDPWALLDSGATHPLRPLAADDCLEDFEKVWVALADGKKVPMQMTAAGVMISVDQNIEPIIPLGWLAESGCTVEWKSNGLQVKHPRRGLLPVQVRSGCPQISRQLAFELIREYEILEVEKMVKRFRHDGVGQASVEEELRWMKDLCRVHPVLGGLPHRIREALVVEPGAWSDAPANRHKRKKLKEGYVLHLYSGAREGFTLEKAMTELNLGRRVLEVDLKHGEEHDMLGSSKVYSGLIRTALSGALWGIVGGPNCRSRSVLRHYPGGPRPIRSWGGGEFGRDDATEAELKLAEEDDILLWRMVFLAIVSDMVLKANGSDRRIVFGLEQPAEPEYKPEVVSFWWTEEWRALRDLMGWHEQKLNQGDFVERPVEVPVKPTKMGGSLSLEVPKKKNPLARSRDDGVVLDSKDLARWVPMMMRAVSKALADQVFGHAEVKLRALTWDQHVSAGHVPFRRDCRVCQEASAKGRPHRKVKHPLAGTLSIDTAGPFPLAEEDGENMKFIVVGAFTWLRPVGGDEDPPDEALEGDVPLLEIEGEEDDVQLALADGECEEADDGLHADGEEGEPDQGDGGEILHGEGELRDDQGELRAEPEINVYRMCIAVPAKTAKHVMEAINAMYIQLRTNGYTVARVHTDRGGEFRGDLLKRWCIARSIHRSQTAGVSSQANGRVERSIQEIKARIQRILLGAGWTSSSWPLACRFVHEMERRRMSGKDEKHLVPR